MNLSSNCLHYKGYEVHEDLISGEQVFYIQTKGHGSIYFKTFDEVMAEINRRLEETICLSTK